MIIQSCLRCRFHEFRREEKERISYCQKENCWAEFSKCIMKKALNRFLEQELKLPLAASKNQSLH